MDLQKLESMARELEQTDALELIEAAKVTGEDTLNIAITGNFNAGKTSLINAIAGKELREVSGISEDAEVPLRLSFERMQEKEGFECVDVYNAAWNEEDVIFYDLKFTDIFEAGRLKPVMYDMDMVFFLVSALQVFTAEDMYALGLLKNYGVKVLLTKLDAVEEESKESVITFVNDMCQKLGLDNAIVIEKGNTERTGKQLRALLPDFTETEQVRTKRAEGFASEARELLTNTVRDKLTALENAKSEDDVAPPEDYLAKSLTLRNRILEKGLQKSSDFSLPATWQRELEKRIYRPGKKSQFNSDWENGIIQSTVERFLGECFEQVQSDLIGSLKADYEQSVNFVGLAYRKEVEREIVELAKQRPVYSDTAAAPQMQEKNNSSLKKIAIAAAIMAGTLIVPIPSWAGIIVALGTTVTTAGAISNDKEKEKLKIKQAIAAYCELVLSHFAFSMKEYINASYNHLADIVGKQYEESQKQASTEEDEQQESEQTARLNSLLEALEQM